jgi:hypothetical protein
VVTREFFIVMAQIPPNNSTAAKPAIMSPCHSVAHLRRFADWKRWAMNKAANQRRVMGLVLLLAVCALMQGCIGAGIAWTHSGSCSNPDLDYLVQGKLRDRGAPDTNGTPAWLQTNWGKPTSVTRSGKEGTTEVWTYDYGLNWNGAMLFVLIPIPLEVPLGHEWTQVVIRDGRVIGAKLHHTHSGGGVLGWTVRSPIDDFGFHSLSRFQ